MTPELLEALETLLREHISDWIYDIRAREGLGWDGPRVTAWGKACEIITNAVKEDAK